MAWDATAPTGPPRRGRGSGQLRLQWRNHLGGAAPPHLPRWLLLRLLAYRLQVAALGDLDKATLRTLRLPKRDGDGIRTAARSRRAGRRHATGSALGRFAARSRMERQAGAGHDPRERLRLERATYRSLSQIAKAMTGTSWNGHRFFGLRPAKDRGVFPEGNRSSHSNRGHDAVGRAPRLANVG